MHVSETHPHRAVEECLSGFACYEAPVGATGPVEGVHRGVVLTVEEATEWLAGLTPEKLLFVPGLSVRMKAKRPPVVGVPVNTTDGRVLCYFCYNTDDTAEFESWMPEDVDNYPVKCEHCGVILLHPTQRPR